MRKWRILMGAFMITAGVVFLVGGIAVLLATTKTSKEAKANEHRIVRMSDGTYRLQYYWDRPGWIDFSGEYKSEAEARRILERLEAKHDWPTPQEVIQR